ncbi:MAG: class I SAM-dependent methyltransferase [Actinobacteria bacterium]|nr:class I SAM-dependent methyltransferase [Actinomycetota bacterium]
MLTIDYDKLDLQPGMSVLDMGAGAGRHSFEAYRRGARVIALDYSFADLEGVRDLFWAMAEAGEVPKTHQALAVRGDAFNLPFADNTFDRIICSEVLEHLMDDSTAMAELFRVLKPGGRIAVSVPTWLTEKICWALSAEYHAPLAEGGHVRIYTEKLLRERLEAVGLQTDESHREHSLHSPYWFLRCIVSPTNSTHPLVKAYHSFLVWDMMKAPTITRAADRLLNPILGKAVVVYSNKPQAVPTEKERSDSVAA